MAARTSMSAEKRRKLIFEVGLELWRVSNARILEETKAGERLVTHYQATLTNPRRELERIVRFAGLNVSGDTLDEAARAVSPRMRHHEGDNVPLDPELATLYAQLSREAEYEP
jgi:hypothetical protein